jgi:hypothetical protein
MKNFIQTKGLIICVVLIMIPLFYGFSHASGSLSQPENQKPIVLEEAFDANLYQKLRSVDDVVTYINQTYKGDKKSLDFVHYISNVISNRFYSGYSYYTPDDNWMAALAGNLIWDDLAAIVIPDDILKHPNASCSQQSIVLMETVKRLGIEFRQVTFDHHFSVELKLNGKWQYVDPNLEVVSPGGSTEDLIRNNRFTALYSSKLSPQVIDRSLVHPKWGKENTITGEKAKWFQLSCNWLSANMMFVLMFLQTLFFFLFSMKPRPTHLLEH